MVVFQRVKKPINFTFLDKSCIILSNSPCFFTPEIIKYQKKLIQIKCNQKQKKWFLRKKIFGKKLKTQQTSRCVNVVVAVDEDIGGKVKVIGINVVEVVDAGVVDVVVGAA